jgi:hypothetical protein
MNGRGPTDSGTQAATGAFMMIARFAVGSLLTVGGLALAACSSAEPTGPGTSESQVNKAKDKDKDKDKKSDPKTAEKTETPPAKTLPSAAVCGAKKTHSECATCCDGDKGINMKVADDKFDACLCAAAKAKCNAEEAKFFCEPKTDEAKTTSTTAEESVDDVQASTCEPDFDKCGAEAKTACAADPLCAAAGKCYVESKCDDKEPGPDEAEDEVSSKDMGTSDKEDDQP